MEFTVTGPKNNKITIVRGKDQEYVLRCALEAIQPKNSPRCKICNFISSHELCDNCKGKIKCKLCKQIRAEGSNPGKCKSCAKLTKCKNCGGLRPKRIKDCSKCENCVKCIVCGMIPGIVIDHDAILFNGSDPETIIHGKCSKCK